MVGPEHRKWANKRMDFSFTDEQRMLRDNLAAWLREHYSFEARRQASLSDTGWRADVWRALASELGILGVALPESVGGLDGGPVDQMVIMEELGRALVIEPYLECAVVAASLLEATGGAAAHALLGEIAAGETIAVLAWSEPTARFSFRDAATRATRDGAGWRLSGAKAVVAGAPWASKLIVTARTGGATGEAEGLSLFLVDRAAPGVTLTAYPTIDGRRAADVTLNDVALGADALIGPEGGALPLVEQAGDRAIAALSAEAVGITRFMLDATVDYTRQRRQFGQPIASFQVLQHRMVDMFMQVEMATSAMYLATLKLPLDPVERALAASSAKVTVANACRFVGQNAIQLHGGMGMTEEMAVTHYFKRATVLEHDYGSVDHHLARFDRLTRLRAAAA